MSRVLVTGANGFVGRAVVKRLTERGHDVVALDLGVSSTEPGVQSVVGDIVEGLPSGARGCDVVVNLAGIVGTAASLNRPVDTVNVNALGALQMLQAAAADGTKRFIQASTEDVYGHDLSSSVTESSPRRPVHPYSIAKVAAEDLARYYSEYQHLNVAVLRLSWVYGPGFSRRRIPHNFVDDAIQGIPTTLATGGDHRLDLTHIDDAVDGILAAVEVDHLAPFAVFNVASGVAHTVHEVAHIVADSVPGWQAKIGPGPIYMENRAPLAVHAPLDISAARRALGYAPNVSLREGIAELINMSTSEGDNR